MERHVFGFPFGRRFSIQPFFYLRNLNNSIGGDKFELWKSYYTYGGLPGILELDSEKKKAAYLRSLHETVYLKDIIVRNDLKNSEEFMELMRVMASCIGSPCNPSKLGNTFKSLKNETLDRKTISKYYFQDIGLRNALLKFRQVEENHIMENVIYNEFRFRGFCVDVGMVEARTAKERKRLEVDFVANMADRRYYIQSAFAMPDDEKREQESASLKRIDDSFKKIIIMRDDIKPYHDNNGFLLLV